MGKYSIKDLEQLSGIKAHTIRIWEKRHKLIEPLRTQTNIRFYSDDDLKKIINVSLLNANGLKISKIAGMTSDEINQKIIELSESNSEATIHIDQLVIAMVELEEEKFEKVLSGLVLRFGFEATIVQIIYPFLEKIGVLWQTQHINPAHEHFISNLIRQKVIVAIDALPIPAKNAKKAMLFLPEQELHEIALLFTNYRMRKAGIRTIYLGQTVPFVDLKSTYQTYQPHILLASVTASLPRMTVSAYADKLANEFPESTILLTGYQIQNYSAIHEHVHVLKNLQELDLFLM